MAIESNIRCDCSDCQNLTPGSRLPKGWLTMTMNFVEAIEVEPNVWGMQREYFACSKPCAVEVISQIAELSDTDPGDTVV